MGVYIYIYYTALELDVVMATFLPVDFSKANFPKVSSYQSLVYIAALLQARVTTYTPNLPLMLYLIRFVSYI